MSKADTSDPSIREDGLQLEEHRSFHERFWTIERWAWIVFGLVLLAALAGLTGSGGPLAHSTARSAAGEVEYPMIARWEATDELVVTFAPGGSEHRMALSPDFSRYFQVEDIQPQPERSIAGSEGEVLVFETDEQAPAQVTMHVRALRPGIASYDLSIDGTPSGLTTIILP